jgi:hypothetical protein
VELRDASGTVVTTRRAHNAVLRGGAELLGDLFRGASDAGPVNRMGVGADPNPEVPPFGSTDLAGSHESTGELQGPREVELTPDTFTATVDDDGPRLLVTARVILPAGDDTALRGPVAEAGLLHRGDDGHRLYNRVTFEPIDKRAEQELSLYWEIAFPFGDPD